MLGRPIEQPPRMYGEQDDLASEERVVREWREEQFIEMGCDFTTAALLAVTPGAELATARKLLRWGCPLDLMVSILR